MGVMYVIVNVTTVLTLAVFYCVYNTLPVHSSERCDCREMCSDGNDERDYGTVMTFEQAVRAWLSRVSSKFTAV